MKLTNVKLKEIANMKYGKMPRRSDISENGYPIYSGYRITGYAKSYLYKEPQLIVVARGVGGTGDVKISPKYAWITNLSIVLEINKEKVDRTFLYYKLKKEPLRENLNTGAAQAQITIGVLENYKVKIPELTIQKKIAAILSAYDKMIENNNRRIEILEEIAERIYKEWFVHFRFPGHEKVKMIDSELGKIPEGWEILKLGEILENIESGSRPKGGIDPEERGLPSIGAENVLGLGHYDFSKEKYVSEDFYQSMRKGKIQSGDVLLYKDGAKIGRKSMFKDGFPHKVCCINEHVFILRTKSKCSQNYLFFYLDRSDITKKIVNLNTNAAQPGINQVGVKSIQILLPPGSLIRLFDDKVGSIISLLFNLAKKNQILRKKRDFLLPKVIFGTIDVSDLDIKTEEIK